MNIYKALITLVLLFVGLILVTMSSTVRAEDEEAGEQIEVMAINVDCQKTQDELSDSIARMEQIHESCTSGTDQCFTKGDAQEMLAIQGSIIAHQLFLESGQCQSQ